MWMSGEMAIQIGGEEFCPWLVKQIGLNDYINTLAVSQTRGNDWIDIQVNGKGFELDGVEFWMWIHNQLPESFQSWEWLAGNVRWNTSIQALEMIVAFDSETHPSNWSVKPTFLR